MKKAIKVLLAVEAWGTVKVLVSWLFNTRGIRLPEQCNKTDKDLINESGSHLLGLHVDADEEYTLDGVHLSVYYNPYMILASNRVGSMVIINPETKSVFVEKCFFSMSDNAKKVALAHEVGHIKDEFKGSITYPVTRFLYILAGKVMPEELRADAYMVSKVGAKNAIRGLKEFKKYSFSIFARIEINLRIKKIKKTIK